MNSELTHGPVSDISRRASQREQSTQDYANGSVRLGGRCLPFLSSVFMDFMYSCFQHSGLKFFPELIHSEGVVSF